ncbi:SpoIIE family protein phosphatase [Cellulomonas shaoxiangyii]|uniref:GAF domain-containing protein n=1 Tax=Cellulomonas shaoxiangyii TaxID=2566013 RepID=A0A4V1CMN5_9CELL|nr:SpoIIE family protein phosphatase [Cellulomonas shaoxiangyii]QCB93565.1 GAF domain-containing protein [Cellulomonas shaoxiangyii]TGY86887.1 GAF domain-containing protein [Cellulomonas shaoxiangyii]
MQEPVPGARDVSAADRSDDLVEEPTGGAAATPAGRTPRRGGATPRERAAADGGAAARSLTDDVARTAAARRLLRAEASGGGTLQALVELAGQLLGTPSAELSLLTDERVVVGGVDPLPGPVGTRTSLVDSLCARVGAAGERVVVDDAAGDPRLAGSAAVAGGRLGAYLGVPLRGDDRRVVGAMCVHQPHARRWTPQDVATLEHLAAAAAAQLEVHALDREYARVDRLALLDAAAQAAGLGTFQWDLATGALHWDASLLEVFAYDADSFGGTIDAFRARVHREDRAHVTAALDAAIATCGVYEAEFRVVRPDGSTRWLSARGRALAGAAGTAEQVIGVATDTTALRTGEERVGRVLEDMTVGYYWLDPDWRIGYVNAEAERILGRTREHLLGGVLWDLFPAAVGTEFEEGYRTVARTGAPAVFDAYYPAPLDGWYEVRAVPEHGGVAAYFTDVTARRHALDAAQEARERSELLAAVAAGLVEILDPVEALRGVLPHLVPAVADFAVASLLDEGHAGWQQRLHDVAALHADPAMQPVLEEYRAVRVPALTRSSMVAQVLAGGAQALRTGLPSPGDLVEDGPAHELLTALAPDAMVVMPLRGRGRTRGLLTLGRSVGRGAFTDADLTALRDVMAQIGLALDNAHLHAARRDLAEELQRSLLTELPEPDHLHLVARYVPAATGAQIGGDWYDAFVVRDGSTCLVIGDVTGHDLRAAVAMAQVRNVLRGGAHAVVKPPAHILASLDWAIHDLAVGALSTGILAKVEQPADLAEQGFRLLRWSNAGHLPPLLLHPEGHAELLARPADMLLGLRPHNDRHDHTVVVRPGSTVLLYTDGLVERRGEPLTVGLERLRTAAEALADLPLEELCDRLIADLASGSDDDVALLAVRAHPEDEPRPAEAGPSRTPADLAADASPFLPDAPVPAVDPVDPVDPQRGGPTPAGR